MTALYSVPDSVLKEFVRHSNAIEGYSFENYGERSRLYRAHLATAKFVVRTGTWDPLKLHFALLDGTDMLAPHLVGVYRNSQVYIGNFYPPSPGAHLLAHVTRWRIMVEAGPGEMDPEAWCWQVHDEFECCHPFVDGNGRTGRLILNAQRLRLGLPWLTVHHGDEQQRYYNHIRDYQSNGRWKCSQWKSSDDPRSILSERQNLLAEMLGRE